MSSNEYHFISRWRVYGTLEEVTHILGDARELPRWWPSVYLDVTELAPGEVNGLGRKIALHTKGWLPYTLRWHCIVTEIRKDGFTLEAEGDFVGRGIWTFEPDGNWVNITYDWKISANKPLLKTLSFAMKPIFAANHRWAMAQGEKSLRLELARQRVKTPEERSFVPAPPTPSTLSRIPLLGAIIGLGLMIYRLFRNLSHHTN